MNGLFEPNARTLLLVIEALRSDGRELIVRGGRVIVKGPPLKLPIAAELLESLQPILMADWLQILEMPGAKNSLWGCNGCEQVYAQDSKRAGERCVGCGAKGLKRPIAIPWAERPKRRRKVKIQPTKEET